MPSLPRGLYEVLLTAGLEARLGESFAPKQRVEKGIQLARKLVAEIDAVVLTHPPSANLRTSDPHATLPLRASPRTSDRGDERATPGDCAAPRAEAFPKLNTSSHPSTRRPLIPSAQSSARNLHETLIVMSFGEGDRWCKSEPGRLAPFHCFDPSVSRCSTVSRSRRSSYQAAASSSSASASARSTSFTASLQAGSDTFAGVLPVHERCRSISHCLGAPVELRDPGGFGIGIRFFVQTLEERVSNLGPLVRRQGQHLGSKLVGGHGLNLSATRVVARPPRKSGALSSAIPSALP